MNNKNEQPKSKMPIFVTIFTLLLIQAFLSGKIIDIPHGTHQGGVICAVGVAIILVSMVLITFLIRLFVNRKNKSK